MRRFTLEEGGEDATDDWTADSKSVIVVANRRDHYSIRIVPITGGAPELIFTIPNWSYTECGRPPSNRCLVAEPTDDHKQAVFTYFDPVKGRGRELTRLDLNAGFETIKMRISNDGTKLAFAPGPEGPIQIHGLGGGGLEHVIRTKELGKLESFEWRADGKGLVVIRTLANTHAQIVHVDFQGNAKALWTCGGDTCFANTISRRSAFVDLRAEDQHQHVDDGEFLMSVLPSAIHQNCN